MGNREISDAVEILLKMIGSPSGFIGSADLRLDAHHIKHPLKFIIWNNEINKKNLYKSYHVAVKYFYGENMLPDETLKVLLHFLESGGSKWWDRT